MEVVSASRLDPDISNQAQDTLKGALDDILEQYLDLVHRYTSLHQSMAEDFASVRYWSSSKRYHDPLNVDLGIPLSSPSQFLKPQQATVWPGLL